MYSIVLEEVCHAVGYTATRTLLEWYGGSRLYVPSAADPNHPLRYLLGKAAFEALVDAFAGSHFDFPRKAHEDCYGRDRSVAIRFAQGASAGEIAQEFKITTRRAEQLRVRLQERGWLRFAGGPPGSRGRARWTGPSLILGTGEVSGDPPPPSAAASSRPTSAAQLGQAG